MAIKIMDRKHYDEVFMFACVSDKLDSFMRNYTYLRDYAGGKCVCELYKDFAPYSFYFVMRDQNGEIWFNGGMIFHGQIDGYGSGSAPTFSVTLEPCDGWSIHT